MRLPSLIATAAAVLLLGAPDAFAELYRWTDDAGRENFTNDLSRIPERYRGSSAPIEASPDQLSVGERSTAPLGDDARRAKVRDSRNRDEQYWRRQAQRLRGQLQDLENEHDIVLREERELAEQASDARNRKRSESLSRKRVKLEQKIVQARRKLESDLPEEARKAGALPGWLRE